MLGEDSAWVRFDLRSLSRWEPCGLVQMEAMRLGTLPIVAPTGGLKDTVEARKIGPERETWVWHGFSPCHKRPGVFLIFRGSQQRPSLSTGCRAGGTFPSWASRPDLWRFKQKEGIWHSKCVPVHLYTPMIGVRFMPLCSHENKKGLIVIHETVKQ